MDLSIYTNKSKRYTNPSQQIRVSTESWVNREIYCPNCGKDLDKFENGRPVADFHCLSCLEEFELKSKKDSFNSKVVDGAYQTMVDRLLSKNNPNFFLLNYDPESQSIINFLVIPKYFFIPKIIEKRNPLTLTAKRAGWVGCNILIKEIPTSGKVFYIKNREIINKENVLHKWESTKFLKDVTEIPTKGWILDIMHCIESIGEPEFNLEEVYAFEKLLSSRHPNNHHIREKIRQQLQLLRDKNYLDFTSKGNYRLIRPDV